MKNLRPFSIIYCQCHYSNRTFFAFLSIICPSLCMRRSLISLLCVWMCDCNDFVLVLFMSFLGIILYFLLPLCVITVMRAQLGQKKRNKLNSSRPSIDSFAVQLPEFSLRIARVQKQESRIENRAEIIARPLRQLMPSWRLQLQGIESSSVCEHRGVQFSPAMHYEIK